MITTATLPDDLELHEGEEFDLHAVAKNGTLFITHVLRSANKSRQAERDQLERQAGKDAAFERFSVGITISPPPTDQDLSDARLEYLLEKHVK